MAHNEPHREAHEPAEHLNEITGRLDYVVEAVRKLEAADKRKAAKPTPPPAIEERRSLYRTVGTVVTVLTFLFVLLAGLSMLLRAGVL